MAAAAAAVPEEEGGWVLSVGRVSTAMVRSSHLFLAFPPATARDTALAHLRRPPPLPLAAGIAAAALFWALPPASSA